jgi:AraC-like DNA-binding protein
MTTPASIHAHGLDEASEQLAPYLQVRYVQLERGSICFHGAATRLGAVTVGHYGGSRNKVEWIDIARERTLIVVPKQGRARVGTARLTRLQAVIAHGPMQLVAFTDRECQWAFASMPTPRSVPELRMSRVQRIALSESQQFEFENAEPQAALFNLVASWTRSPAEAAAARCHAAVRAREFIDHHLDQRLSLASVCRASYSSPRALEYGFQEVFGISPMAYVRCSRLSRVRRELYGAPSVNGIVTQLAMKWGFWHLSQFSKDYYELFGELPSATLSRANNHSIDSMLVPRSLRNSDSRVRKLPSLCSHGVNVSEVKDVT